MKPRCPPRGRRWCALLAGLATLASSAAAEELEDVLRGFDTASPFDLEHEELPGPPPPPRSWHFAGSLDLSTHFAPFPHRSTSETRYAGLTLLRGRLGLLFDAQLPRQWRLRVGGHAFADAAYRIHGRSRYTREVLDTYQWEADFGEVWLEGPLHWNLDLALGRQILIWGRADDLRIVDVLNPLDLREPGLTDLEVIRLPVSALRLSTQRGPWTLSGIAIPEMRFSIEPPYGSDFYPEFPLTLPPAVDNGSLDPAAISIWEPDASLSHTNWAVNLTGVFPGWDLSLYWARFWDDRAVFETDLRNYTCCPLRLPPLESRYFKGSLYGAAGSRVLGAWLLEAEVAARSGQRYTTTETISTFLGPVQVSTGTLEKWRLDALLGIEYYGIANLVVSLEVALRHIFDFDERMRNFGAVPDLGEAALRVTARFLGERLETTALLTVLGDPAPDAGALRVSARYVLRDGLAISGGAIAYRAGSLLPTRRIGRNHRLFVRLEYSF